MTLIDRSIIGRPSHSEGLGLTFSYRPGFDSSATQFSVQIDSVKTSFLTLIRVRREHDE